MKAFLTLLLVSFLGFAQPQETIGSEIIIDHHVSNPDQCAFTAVVLSTWFEGEIEFALVEEDGVTFSAPIIGRNDCKTFETVLIRNLGSNTVSLMEVW